MSYDPGFIHGEKPEPMKSTVTAVVTAAFFAAVATEIYFRFLDGEYVVLMAMFFAVGLATTWATLRFLARQPKPKSSAAPELARKRPPRRREHRPQAPSDANRESGTVKWFDRTKGYGFVIRPNGDEIFVHHRSVRRQGRERASLDDGQAVSFVAVEQDRGWQAEDVVPE